MSELPVKIISRSDRRCPECSAWNPREGGGVNGVVPGGGYGPLTKQFECRNPACGYRWEERYHGFPEGFR